VDFSVVSYALYLRRVHRNPDNHHASARVSSATWNASLSSRSRSPVQEAEPTQQSLAAPRQWLLFRRDGACGRSLRSGRPAVTLGLNLTAVNFSRPVLFAALSL